MEDDKLMRRRKPSQPQKKKKSKGKIAAVVIMVIVLLFAAIAAAGALWWNTSVKPPDIPVEPEDAEDLPTGVQKADGMYSVLVVGTDKVGLNTDTIFVASFDTINDKINVMSIPRDTMSANVKRTVKKINAAYGVGGKANIDNLKKEIKALVGFTPNYYVVVNLDAFTDLIDAIGGVKIDVPRDMNYEDPYQNLSIHIKKGEQVLNGKDAVGFVRYRKGYAEGDLGRVKAQQLFMTALADQLAQPSTITKLPKIADIISKNMTTDLSVSEILWFGQQAVEVDMTQDLNMFVLPGEAHTVSGLSYYIPSSSDILEIVNEHFNPYDHPITKLDTVNLSTMRNQSAEEKKKSAASSSKDKEEDPDVAKEKEQEKSDVAGSDKKTTTKDDKEQEPSDSDKPEDKPDDVTDAPPETKPAENEQTGGAVDEPSTDVVLNEFGQPYVPESTPSETKSKPTNDETTPKETTTPADETDTTQP